MVKENQVDDLGGLLADCKDKLAALNSNVKDKAIDRFVSSGGCNHCRGRGWVVTWDTLDCTQGSYAIYGSCDAEGCTADSRMVSGLKPGNNKYDRFNQNSTWAPLHTDEEAKNFHFLNSQIIKINIELKREIETWTPSQGKLVKVVKSGGGPKSRRVPIGVEGLVVKQFTNNWGTTKLLVKDKHGQQWWPTIKNVCVVDPKPDLAPWDILKKKELEKSGYPAVVSIRRASGKAALIRTTTGKEFWVPTSQVSELKGVLPGKVMSIMLPMWLAQKNGLVTKG